MLRVRAGWVDYFAVTWTTPFHRFRDWMAADDLDLRNPLSVLGTRRAKFADTVDGIVDAGGSPDGAGKVWQYLVVSRSSAPGARAWELVGPQDDVAVPYNATLEYVAAALANFGWRLLGSTDAAGYVFRRPTPVVHA